jgi:hypothetical protein
MATTPGNKGPEELGVMSPFRNMPEQSHLPPPQDHHHRHHLSWKWVLTGLLFVGVIVGGVMLDRVMRDPYRTLEVFSVDKYFDNPRSLTGNRFQATLRVEGDLGWSAGVGKLMVFSVENDTRFIPVVVQGNALNFSFSKGQAYLAEIRVEDGGLLYATELRKK